MKVIALLLVSLLAWDVPGFASQARSAPETLQVETQETPQAAKIKAKVHKRGIGQKVRVKLANGTETKGIISKIEESSFTLTNNKTGQTTDIPYADVQKVGGSGLSKGATIALVVVGGVVIACVAMVQSVKE